MDANAARRTKTQPRRFGESVYELKCGRGAAALLRDGRLRGEARERYREPSDTDGDECGCGVRLTGEKKRNAEGRVTSGDDAVHESGIFHDCESYSLGIQASKYLTECLSSRSISA